MDEEQQFGRAKNAILSFFEQRLSIPKIYIDAEWDGREIDVLAINRDGVGDVYAVRLFARRYMPDGRLDNVRFEENLVQLLSEFPSIPANYKFIAAFDPEYDEPADKSRFVPIFRIPDHLAERLFSPDGIGRIGLLQVCEENEEKLITKEILRPERFRAKIAKLADEYVQQHEADWEIRA
jgi:hypothetical protein